MEYLLGIDVGTNGTKSVLFTTDGDFVDMAYRGYELLYPQQGWVEQRALDWWEALVETVGTLVKKHGVSRSVKALSLSAQGGATVMLDKGFKPLANAVSWLDMRASETQPALEEKISRNELYRICGWERLNACNFPVLFWFKEKHPEVIHQARHFASTIDYINYRLTGRFVIDYSNLALTFFLDLNKQAWSEGLLDIVGIEKRSIAEIIPSGKVIGNLREDAAEELGLPADVTVVSGGHDQYCASIGAGAIEIGDCVLSSGTAWVLLATSDKLAWDENHLISPGIHLLKDRYGLMAAVSSAGDSLNWFQSTFQRHMDLERLSDEVQKVSAGSDGMVFVPKWTAKSERASFINVDTAHDRMHFARAVFEGVALANRRHIEAFHDMGMKIEKLVMIGGATRSSVWPSIVADVSGVLLEIPEQKEAACAGAAILAGVGSGVFPSVEEAAKKFTGKTERIEPDMKNRDVYGEAYTHFISVLEYV
jgi:sugar (pentulose or hexulose) kinase